MYIYICIVEHSTGIFIHVTLFNQGINVDTINVTLVPVPGQPYVYKASVEGNNNIDDVSASTATSDLSAFIIRVSTNENNLTTYNLLVSWCYLQTSCNCYDHCLA